jgi:hypothetical protein
MLSFDPGRAAAVVRKGDHDELRGHYRRAFGGDSGAIVLLDLLVRAQVAQRRDGRLSDRERAFHDGRADLALQILDLAGCDPIAVTLGVMTDTLEGENDDRHDDAERQRPDYDPGNASGGDGF